MLKKLHEQKLFYIAFALILADQLSKIWIKGFSLFGWMHEGMSIGTSVPAVGEAIRMTYVENPGMAFGIEFGAAKIFLSLFSVLAAIALGWYLYRLRNFSIWVQIGVMLLLAGATGNLIDRVFYGVFYGTDPLFFGKVVDFIDVDIPNVTVFGRSYERFWIFNVADSCVSCGIVLLLFVNSKIPIFSQLMGKATNEEQDEPIVIEEYNPEWEQEFNALKDVLASHMGENIVAIEHIGSTAVVGLAAKPILDVDIVIESMDVFPAVKETLEALGYEYEGDKGILGREAFRQTSVQTPIHENRAWMKQHLYVCAKNSDALANHLLLRERLRSDENARNSYAALKKKLAEEFRHDRAVYTEAKTEFINSLLAEARTDAPSGEENSTETDA